MKIAIVRQRYNPYGGAERFVERVLAALANNRVGAGVRVSIITRKWRGGEQQAIECKPFYLGSLWRDWGFARCVCRLLQREKFDLVQSHERLSCCDIYRAGDGVHREWLAQRAQTQNPLQSVLTRLNPYHRYVLAAERAMFASKQLKAVICNSHMVKQEIQRYFALPDDRLHVIYSGIDSTEYHPGLRRQYRQDIRLQLGVVEETPVFLYVGSGFARKGLAVAMQALASVPQAHLWVVGKDKHSRRYQKLAGQLGISERMRFLGGQQDVKPYYAAADALVLPTLYDPFPNVALEAMACGLPVITSEKSGAAELLRHGESGFVFPASDTAGVAMAMQRLCSPQTAQAMGAAARNAVLPYSPAAMAAAMRDLYANLLKQSSSANSL